MIVNPNLCSGCSQSKDNLELIETRFEGGLCFVELRCMHCASRWTAEVSMPEREDFELAKRRPDLPTPKWRLVDIVPANDVTACNMEGKSLERRATFVPVAVG